MALTASLLMLLLSKRVKPAMALVLAMAIVLALKQIHLGIGYFIKTGINKG